MARRPFSVALALGRSLSVSSPARADVPNPDVSSGKVGDACANLMLVAGGLALATKRRR